MDEPVAHGPARGDMRCAALTCFPSDDTGTGSDDGCGTGLRSRRSTIPALPTAWVY
ncbi:hypothetical protein EV562_12019 [Streptomyces sp. BK208]|uniref:hypothetical protein n=1 Tax=Streptomyces sp. BK208 TaxID=2512150 RepID=UPI0010D21777|nr:hypothetical protein [Streptomyces sp. BK208]TDT23064.1 hypothetical protein EV562_12019 [Streptomyces sp. BK208]